jgi:twitching motility protein PilT
MARIDALLELVLEHGASDLHVRPGGPPMIRLHGRIEPLTEQIVSRELIDLMLSEIMDDESRAALERDKDVDFAYEVAGKLRVRCNVFHHDQGLGAALPRAAEQDLHARRARAAAGARRDHALAARPRDHHRTAGIR